MAKKKKKTKKDAWGREITPAIQFSAPVLKYTHETFKVRHGLWTRRTIPKVFARDVPALAVTSKVTKTQIPNKAERIPKLYEGFQPEPRVTSCDRKRERRRRAYFGYLKSPHAGQGNKQKSPRSDRFTVNC